MKEHVSPQNNDPQLDEEVLPCTGNAVYQRKVLFAVDACRMKSQKRAAFQGPCVQFCTYTRRGLRQGLLQIIGTASV
jgi:hypothetical protein